MFLGLSLSDFTVLHVVLSFLGIVSGFAALILRPLGSRTSKAVTALFLATTLATSVSGFMFPFMHLGPGHVTGALTLVALVPVLLARYRYRLAGPWHRVYAIGAAVVLYLNVFVAVLQAFGKMTALHPLAPTPGGSPLLATQLFVLALFVALFILAAKLLDPPVSGRRSLVQRRSTRIVSHRFTPG